MRRLYWSILIAIAVLIAGLFLGITALVLAPILGFLVLLAILVWLGERRARHEPPVD